MERWGGVVSSGVLRNGDPAEKQSGAEGYGGFSGLEVSRLLAWLFLGLLLGL